MGSTTELGITWPDDTGFVTDGAGAIRATAESAEDAILKQTKEAVVTTAASGASHTFDLAGGPLHDLTLTDNCTLTMPPLVDGTSFLVRMRQDATGTRTPTFPATVAWPGKAEPTWSTTANAVDIIAFHCDGTLWHGAAQLDSGVPA